MTVQVNQFDSAAELNQVFAQRILAQLKAGIEQNGYATLVVSGGRTPKLLFNLLSQQVFPWDKVTVTLADERWVNADDDSSNEKLVKSELLINKAAEAKFIGLVSKHSTAFQGCDEIEQKVSKIDLPFDVVILGMGEDGHTASLFPCSDQVVQGLDVNNENRVIAVEPTTAPHQRMSFTYSALVNSKQIFLHLVGESKLPVLNKAINGDDALEMPIRAFMHQQNVPFEVMFALS